MALTKVFRLVEIDLASQPYYYYIASFDSQNPKQIGLELYPTISEQTHHNDEEEIKREEKGRRKLE